MPRRGVGFSLGFPVTVTVTVRAAVAVLADADELVTRDGWMVW